MRGIRVWQFCLLFFTAAVLAGIAIPSSRAQYLDPTHKTNVNKIEPLFETNLMDHKQLEQGAKNSIDSAIEGIKGNRGLDALVGYDKAESEASRLSAIPHQDLQQSGREEKAKSPWLDEYFIDYSKPGNLKYRQTAEEIAAKTGEMINNILGKLKDIGVDCRTVKGNEIREPKYVIELDQQVVQDTVYDKYICEELRNIYTCKDTLSVRCSSFSSKPLKITASNININHTGDGGMWVGWPACNSFWGGWGQIYHYEIKFNIEDPNNVAEFFLTHLSYDDYVLFKLNGNHVWSGPFGGHRLELHSHTVIIDDSGRGFGAENDTWYTPSLNLNLKTHLKKGENVFNVTLVVGGHGSVIFYLKATEKDCAQWQEERNETCSLR